MTDKQTRLPPLEEGLLTAMRAIDNQIAREMQRSPAELSQQGVQKWEPYEKRVELITAFILDSFGEQMISLDSVLVLAQALPKALHLLAEDLGEKGLGKLRSSYCLAAFKNIESDIFRGSKDLKEGDELN